MPAVRASRPGRPGVRPSVVAGRAGGSQPCSTAGTVWIGPAESWCGAGVAGTQQPSGKTMSAPRAGAVSRWWFSNAWHAVTAATGTVEQPDRALRAGPARPPPGAPLRRPHSAVFRTCLRRCGVRECHEAAFVASPSAHPLRAQKAAPSWESGSKDAVGPNIRECFTAARSSVPLSSRELAMSASLLTMSGVASS